MLPEVKEYFDAANGTVKSRQEALDQTYAKFRETITEDRPGGDYHVFRDGWNQAVGSNNEVRRAAWEKLTESSDVLVRYIAEHFSGSYRSEAEKVLSLLPASREELEALAAEQGWCDSWNNLLEEAVEAGAVARPTGVEAAKKAVDDYVKRHWTAYQPTINQFSAIVENFVAARVAEALAAASSEQPESDAAAE